MESKKRSAYWTVLINVPSIHNDEDQVEWYLNRNKIVDMMYNYFVLNPPIQTAETLKRKYELMMKIDANVEHHCKNYYKNQEFEQLQFNDQLEIVYKVIRAVLNVDMLSEFYNFIVINKPTRYCEKCRKFASTAEC